MSLDSYVTLGRSGLRVSPITLGTMTFGEDLGWGSSPEESKNILAAYLDRGGNSIDTANIYTNGHSEKIIGDYLADQRALRDRLVIGTKFPSYVVRHPNKVVWLVHQFRQAYELDRTDLGQYDESPRDRALRRKLVSVLVAMVIFACLGGVTTLAVGRPAFFNRATFGKPLYRPLR